MTETAATETAYVAMGCFWGAEKLFWQTRGVVDTAVGYMGGHADAPTYQQVCSGRTGHAEVVRVTFDPAVISYADIMRIFVENHDPTQGNRQGNDIGSQYRSMVLTTSDAQRETANAVLADFQPRLSSAGYGRITTEVVDAGTFHPAEEYHQRYLEKNPGGYCPIHATGVTCG